MLQMQCRLINCAGSWDAYFSKRDFDSISETSIFVRILYFKGSHMSYMSASSLLRQDVAKSSVFYLKILVISFKFWKTIFQ